MLTAPGRPSRPFINDSDSNFTLGVTEPTAANTGCRIPLANLKVYSGGEYITQADGEVIEGYHLPQGRIIVRHKNVVIRDCYIQIGPYSDGQKGTYGRNFAIWSTQGGYDTTGLRIEFCTIDPKNCGITGAEDDYGVYGMMVGNAMIYRTKIWRTGDSISHDNTGRLMVYGCYLRPRWWPTDPINNAGSEGLHSDGVQLSGGVGHEIIGNSIQPCDQDGVTPKQGAGMGVVATPFRSLMRDVTIKNNWFRDGGTQISFWPRWNEGGPGVADVKVSGNRHGGTCVWPALATPTTKDGAVQWVDGVAMSGGLNYTGPGTTRTVAAGGVVAPLVTANTQGTGVPA